MGTSRELIVALDFADIRDAEELVQELGDRVGTYKVGLQLLTGAGPRIVTELVEAGKSVFLDLKLHEIPHSVASAVRMCAALGASMVTVHASAGSAVLRAAVEAAADASGLKVVALSVITSLDDKGLAEVGVLGGVAEQVARLTALARDAGCHGVVTSSREVALCRELVGPDALVVVPGVSVSARTAEAHDHVRSGSVAAAIADGASHVVLGRSISRAARRRDAADQAIDAILAATTQSAS